MQSTQAVLPRDDEYTVKRGPVGAAGNACNPGSGAVELNIDMFVYLKALVTTYDNPS
jgi:hypothetical protein